MIDLHSMSLRAPVEQIPTIRSNHPNFYDVEDSHCKWIEPETRLVGYTGTWARYKESVQHLDCSDWKWAGISISIEIRWQTHLYLDCIAVIPYAHAHDEQHTRLVKIPNPKQYEHWVQVYQQLKAEALEWISYVRVPLYQALLLHEEDRRVMGEIARLEYMVNSPNSSYQRIPPTARTIASKCGWFTDELPPYRSEDVKAMVYMLQTLVARGFLLRQGEEYAIAGRVRWEQRDRLQKWGKKQEALVLRHLDLLAPYTRTFGAEVGQTLVGRWNRAILAHPGPVFILHQPWDKAVSMSVERAEIAALEYRRPQMAVLIQRDLSDTDPWLNRFCLLLNCIGCESIRLGGIWTSLSGSTPGSVAEMDNVLARYGLSLQVDRALCGVYHTA